MHRPSAHVGARPARWGLCLVCRRRFRLYANNLLRVHTGRDSHGMCPGGHRPPLLTVAPR